MSPGRALRCRLPRFAGAGMERGSRFSSCRTAHRLLGKDIKDVSSLKTQSNLREKPLKLDFCLCLGLPPAISTGTSASPPRREVGMDPNCSGRSLCGGTGVPLCARGFAASPAAPRQTPLLGQWHHSSRGLLKCVAIDRWEYCHWIACLIENSRKIFF